MTLPLRSKVLAYVTRERELLVFTQPEFDEAGTQVPAGTLEPGEAPEKAVLREIREETGLQHLSEPVLLGVYDCDMRPWKEELHRRHVFHVVALEETPEEWVHWEHHPTERTGPIEFRFRWVDIFDLPIELAGYQGDMLVELRRRLEHLIAKEKG